MRKFLFLQQTWEPLLEPRAGGCGSDRALPYRDHMPALFAKRVFVPQVAGAVAIDLEFPPCEPGFRQAEVGTVFVPVPEAAVDEDDGAVFRQDEVGFTGQGTVFRAVDGEAIAEPVEHRAQGEFRLGIATADAGHDIGALFRGEDVHGKRKPENRS